MKNLILKTILLTFLLTYFVTIISAQSNDIGKFKYENNRRINVQTGVVAARYNIKSPVYQGSPEQIAKQYLAENKAIFGISDVSDLKAIQIIESPAGKHVTFLQTYYGNTGIWFRDCREYQ
jgi:hypothetical protein